MHGNASQYLKAATRSALTALTVLFLFTGLCFAKGRVYVFVWFHVEDYVEPAADDATLRLAEELRGRGVRATFKLVGEKLRTLERRGRQDVIRALSFHDIGYHADTHGIPPAPAVYLRDMGWVDGAAEFERREGPGVADIRRVFGMAPSCYAPPGTSWGPQSLRALLRLGIPAILRGAGIGMPQLFWFGGMLQLPGPSVWQFFDEDKAEEGLKRFDREVASVQSRSSGGVISIGCHETEFVTTKMWDSVNLANGVDRERSEWQAAPRRTAEDSERCYWRFFRFVDHARKTPGVELVTVRDLLPLYRGPVGQPVARARIAAHMAQRQTFLETEETTLSAAEMLLILLGMEPQVVEGPIVRRESTYRGTEISRPAFERAKADVVSFIRTNRRLPAETWVGSERLSIVDFAATLAADVPNSAKVAVRRGNPEMEKYVPNDPVQAFKWPIHPEGFSAPGLLELDRLQTWTLKPAQLK